MAKTGIKVSNLSKRYGANPVITGVSFEVAQGELFALLGNNGAGKTTTIECIEGLRRPDEGNIEVKGSLGVQLQTSSILPECRVKEALTLFALWKHAPTDHLFDLFDIKDFKDKKYGALSIGQKKKLHLALALLGNPNIRILDKPTAGLDVESRLQLHEEIRQQKCLGKTFILASHDMSEVEELCDTLAILRQGHIVYQGSPATFKKQSGQEHVITIKFSKELVYPAFSSCSYLKNKKDYSVFATTHLGQAVQEILVFASKQNADVLDIQTENPRLEQRFMEIAKEPVI